MNIPQDDYPASPKVFIDDIEEDAARSRVVVQGPGITGFIAGKAHSLFDALFPLRRKY
jgi:hypothetical protein